MHLAHTGKYHRCLHLCPLPAHTPAHRQTVVDDQASTAVLQCLVYTGGLLGICSVVQNTLRGQLSATAPPAGLCVKMEASVPVVHSSLSIIPLRYIDWPKLKTSNSHH